MRSILLLPLVARDNRCMYMCGVCGNICCVAAVVENGVFLTLECGVCLCSGCDVCCILCL